MIPQRPQPLLHPLLRMEIPTQQKDGEEEEESTDDGPFDYVGGLLHRRQNQSMSSHSGSLCSDGKCGVGVDMKGLD